MEQVMDMESPTESLDALATQGVVPPKEFEGCPERVVEIAHIPLQKPDVSKIIDVVAAGGIYDKEGVEDAVVSLIVGHVILAGPPGTGKTKLANLLAKAFNVALTTETANPEWSVYDVIGSQVLNSAGGAAPKHGVVTKSIMDCAKMTVQNLDTGQGFQSTWLLIDEINRAEIDRAFGPLFTAISGAEQGRFSLDYLEGSPNIEIPKRFRIICTMNDYDTRFVNSMSGALRRRFARVSVLPPQNVEGMVPEYEWLYAIQAAKSRVQSQISAEQKDAVELMAEHAADIRRVFGSIRQIEDLNGIAIGTAQLIDCCTYAMAYIATVGTPQVEEDWNMLLDRVLETKLISGLETDSTRAHISSEYIESLEKILPTFPRTIGRLRAFLDGSL